LFASGAPHSRDFATSGRQSFAKVSGVARNLGGEDNRRLQEAAFGNADDRDAAC